MYLDLHHETMTLARGQASGFAFGIRAVSGSGIVGFSARVPAKSNLLKLLNALLRNVARLVLVKFLVLAALVIHPSPKLGIDAPMSGY